MRKITKNKEPKEWIKYRLTPNAHYSPIKELRDSLLKEQGYICAYCMRRIPTKDSNSNESSRIEHILSRDGHHDKELDYKNMIICCPGAINENFHCDKSKGKSDITFDLFSNDFFNTITYKLMDCQIVSSNDIYNKEINEILNLNNVVLKRNRTEALNGVITYLNNKGWTKTNIIKQIENWNNYSLDGKLKPYCGLIVWYLQHKIKHMK